jgi:hypothetical protein
MNRITNILFRPLILCLLLFSSSSYAVPAFDWSPSKLNIEQMQGTQSTHTVKVTASENMEGVVARIVPSLQKWLTIAPATIGNIRKGQAIEMVIAINVPPDEPIGTHGGVIELRLNQAGQPQKTVAKPLPINLKITQFVGRQLPPDPGEAGKQTLLGIDSDGDGVRDDVQRYIYLTYPNEPKVQAALIQFANQYQGLLPQADDRDAAYNHAVKLMQHLDCLVGIKGEDFIKISPALRAVILNTKERSLAYIKFSDNLGGQQITATPLKEWKAACAFDVDAVGGGQ